MRLCAIYCVWGDWDMLGHSVLNISELVEGVIIIASNTSNYGEKCLSPVIQEGLKYHGSYGLGDRIEIHLREPQFKNARDSETDKRNYGLNVAREQGYTHFLTIDSDEYYEHEPFLRDKARFKNEPNLKGLVCQCQTYFKKPTLTIGLDTTLVPFIHELTPTIRHEFNRSYPFAWIDGKIRIDPTRSLSINSGVERTDLIMHHASWIRKDFSLKIRNSTARTNLERSTILEDLANAAPGYFCKFYQKTLTECENKFGIPEF